MVRLLIRSQPRPVDDPLDRRDALGAQVEVEVDDRVQSEVAVVGDALIDERDAGGPRREEEADLIDGVSPKVVGVVLDGRHGAGEVGGA